VLNKFLSKLQDEAKNYAVEALTEAVVDKTSFEYGVHHGVMKGFGLVEQWLTEMLEAEDDDENK
jgi:hypothetical protein